MEGNKFRTALLVITAAIIVPCIGAIYGIFIGLGVFAIFAAIIALIIVNSKKRGKEKNIKNAELCSDIQSVFIDARGKNYIISAGNTFGIEENFQSGLRSYIENGIWNIADSGEKGDAPVEIVMPEKFAPQILAVSAQENGVIINTALTHTLALKSHGGSIEVGSMRVNTLKVDAGSGNIKLSLRLSGNAEIICGSGMVKLLLDEAADSYNYEIMTGVGTVKAAGEEFSAGKRSGYIDNHADRVIKVNCGMGNVEISELKESGINEQE